MWLSVVVVVCAGGAARRPCATECQRWWQAGAPVGVEQLGAAEGGSEDLAGVAPMVVKV